MHLLYIACAAAAVLRYRHLDCNSGTVLITVNLTSICRKADGLSGFPKSSFREEVEVPLPYQSVLQRLQLPLDCLTFFINSQVILFPWQQFPADTKDQVSP